LGSFVTSKRSSYLPHAYQLPGTPKRLWFRASG